MPVYLFSCRECGREAEHRCSIKDKPKTIKCPCGFYMEQDFSSHTGTFILNGMGWASDGYATAGSFKAENEKATREAKGIPT